MNRRQQIDLSYQLEERLQQAAERIKRSITTSYTIGQAIKTARMSKRPVLPIPDEVKKWFEETEEYTDE